MLIIGLFHPIIYFENVTIFFTETYSRLFLFQCDKRHMYLCPEYEKFQKCLKSKCPYPHGSSEVNKPKLKKRNLKKIVQQKIIKPIKSSVEETNQIRYYDDKVDKTTKSEKESNLKRSNTDDVPEMSLPKRKKLGSLPSFIPIL